MEEKIQWEECMAGPMVVNTSMMELNGVFDGDQEEWVEYTKKLY